MGELPLLNHLLQPAGTGRGVIWPEGYITQSIHVWNMYLHLVDFYGKCR